MVSKKYKFEFLSIFLLTFNINLSCTSILSLNYFYDVNCDPKNPVEDESDMDLVQNMHVILNPGFCDTDDQRAPLSPIRTTNYYYGYGNDDFEKDNATFSRKMSIFFTGNTIKRI